MKVFRVIAAAAVVAAVAILVHTQTRPGTVASPPQTRPLGGPANIALIDSSAFSDDKNGIARVMNAIRQIEVKFQPLRTELRGMRDRLNTMRADLQKKQAIQDARVTARETEEADQLEIQIKRKTEDAQASYQRESLAAIEPLQKDITTALNAYAQAKGISLLIDVNRVPVLYAATNLDVTGDFIAEYNRTHPVTATPARP
jgi:outer membrane protein